MRSKEDQGDVHADTTIGFRREDVDQGIGVPVEGDGGGGFKEFTIDGGEDSDDIVGTRR